MAECIFCQIVAGKIPSYKIYEDSDYLAFLDIFPKTKGHTLVIPKQHVTWVWDYPDLGAYYNIVGKIARYFQKINRDPIVRSIVWGWDVPHAHIHLLPGKIDNLNGQKLSGGELEKIRRQFSMLE